MRALVILAVLSFGAVADAQEATVKFSLFNNSTGSFEEKTFEGDTVALSQVDQGGYSDELLLVVGVTGTKRITVTAKQGKKTQKKTLKAPANAQETWHAPTFVRFQACGPMTITVTVGKQKTVRTIDFQCGE